MPPAPPDRPSRPRGGPPPPHGLRPGARAHSGADRFRTAGSGPQRSRDDRPARGASAAAGAAWLYGTHPVEAALRNPSRRLRRLLLTAEAQTVLEARLSAPLPILPERAERAGLDRILGRDVVHQGCALLADPLSPPPLDVVLSRPGPVLLLDQVSDPRNVGAILRSAAAFGACAVIVQDRNAPDETGALAKAASGALEAVPILRAVNIARTLSLLKSAGLWCVGLDAGGVRLDGAAFAARRIALVLGAEGEGLRRLVRENCDEIAALPMPGTMESLNVSVAAAVALYELFRPPA